MEERVHIVVLFAEYLCVVGIRGRAFQAVCEKLLKARHILAKRLPTLRDVHTLTLLHKSIQIVRRSPRGRSGKLLGFATSFLACLLI